MGPGAPGLVSACRWVGLVLDMTGCGVGGVSKLVGGAGSWGSWLRGPRCPRAGVGTLVGGAGVKRIPRLVPSHWWVRPGPGVSAIPLVDAGGPGVSGCRVLEVLESVFQPTGGQGQGPGGPGTGAYPLVGEAGPQAVAAPLVGRVGSWGLWLQGPGGPRASVSILVCGLGLGVSVASGS